MSKLRILLATFVVTLGLAVHDLSIALGQSTDELNSFPSLENVFEVKGINAVTMSPSGQEILYTLNTVDLSGNNSDTDIWMVKKVGVKWEDPIRLTNHEDADTNPQWHPDGKKFAFLSSGREPGTRRNGTSENITSAEREGSASNKIMLMSLMGGEPSELLQHSTNIASYQWSPDGNYIAFRASDPHSEQTKSTRRNGRDINIEDEPGNYSNLWLFDISENTTSKLTEGNTYTVGSFSWSHANDKIAFSATPSDQPFDSWKSDLFLIDLSSLETKPQKLTSNPGPDSNPYWSPDDEYIFYMGQQTDSYQIGMNRMWKISSEGGRPEEVSPKSDIQAGRYRFNDQGTGAYFETTTGTTRGLFHVELANRQAQRVTPDSGVRSRFTFSSDLKIGAYIFEDPTRPAEIYVAEFLEDAASGMGEELRVTSHNLHAEKFAVGKTETIQWKNKIDGKEVEGVLLYPVGWSSGDGPRATVVKIHGGPSGVYVENFQAASSGADAQRYAGDGYFVLLPNPRGSSGYGEAGLQAVVQDWGGLDFQDIMSGVDHLVDQGYAHTDSLGVMGWSYGGYMTAWTVTQTKRFKAAVAGAAITENIAMWGTQDIQHVFEAYFGGGPYEPGLWEVYQRSNPLTFIQNATTPTMVIHGENDPRVPPNQARIFYRGLKANGVETKLVWLPRTGHGPREPGLQFERSKAQKDWMDQHIRKFRPIT